MKILLSLCFNLFYLYTTAQSDIVDTSKGLNSSNVYNNSLGFFTATFYLIEDHSFETNSDNSPENIIALLTLQYGISYERKILKDFGIGIAYSQWNRRMTIGSEGLIHNPRDTGYLHFRYDYKMLDVLFYYHYKIDKSMHHQINIAAGPSMCWGKNSYLSFYNVNPLPPYDVQYGYDHRNSSYVGALLQLGYSYTFLRGRLCIGHRVRGRIYPNRPNQIDSEFHIGLNF